MTNTIQKKGGKATKEKYGLDHYREMGRKSAEKQRRRGKWNYHKKRAEQAKEGFAVTK